MFVSKWKWLKGVRQSLPFSHYQHAQVGKRSAGIEVNSIYRSLLLFYFCSIIIIIIITIIIIIIIVQSVDTFNWTVLLGKKFGIQTKFAISGRGSYWGWNLSICLLHLMKKQASLFCDDQIGTRWIRAVDPFIIVKCIVATSPLPTIWKNIYIDTLSISPTLTIYSIPFYAPTPTLFWSPKSPFIPATTSITPNLTPITFITPNPSITPSYLPLHPYRPPPTTTQIGKSAIVA